MPYDPAQGGAADQIRARIGDTADPPLLAGGEERYEAIAAASATVAAGALVAARELEAQLALLPVKTTAEGLTYDYSGRLPGLRATIARLEGEADTAAAESPLQFVTAVYRDTSANDEYSR